MEIEFHYPPGATPLDPDSAEGLIPQHITTQEQLNAWEATNIGEAERWAFGRKHKELPSSDFIRALHRRMFKDTWKWAGNFRKTETRPGIAPEQIAVALRELCANIKAQVEYKSYPMDEIAARFHHLLVFIHPFPNGNGRLARTMTNLFLAHHGHGHFTWGKGDLIAEGELRRRYIAALQAADARNYDPLLEFVRRAE